MHVPISRNSTSSFFSWILLISQYIVLAVCLNKSKTELALVGDSQQAVAKLCKCRVAWPAVMQTWEQWQDVYSPEGQLLFAGLRAKVSVFHGQMTRIVPHTTTGLPCRPHPSPPAPAPSAGQMLRAHQASLCPCFACACCNKWAPGAEGLSLPTAQSCHLQSFALLFLSCCSQSCTGICNWHLMVCACRPGRLLWASSE